MKADSASLAGLFSLSGEAALGVEDGRIVFMNQAARMAIGRELTGSDVSGLMPESMLSGGVEQLVTTCVIGGRRATVSARRLDGLWVFLLNAERDRDDIQLVSPSLPEVSSLLSTISLAVTQLASLADCSGDEKLRASAGVLDRGYHRLRRQIQNISVLYGAFSGSLPCYPAETDVDALCLSVTDGAALYAGKRGVTISYARDESPCLGVVDYVLVEQMLLNILQNSLQHCQEGGSVQVRLSAAPKKLTISVDDDGSGMEPEELSTAFSRWREPRAALGSAASGAGLAAARAIAERHGGALIVESGAARGTSVRVMLPRENESGQSLREPEAEYCSGSDQILTGLSDWLRSEDFAGEWRDE